MKKKYTGYIGSHFFMPLLKGDYFDPINLTKTTLGFNFINKYNIKTSREFNTCAFVLFSEEVGKRKRMLGIEVEEEMYNVLISDVPTEKLIKSLPNICKSCSVIRYDACNIMISTFILDRTRNYKEDGPLLLSIHSDLNVASDLCRAISANGFLSCVIDKDNRKIDIEGELIQENKETNIQVIAKNNDFFVLEEGANIAFITAIHRMKERGFASVLLTGPSGWGKTSSAQRLANHLGYQFHKVDCGAITEPTEIVNIRSFGDGRTFFEKTRFAHLLEEGNAVILLDEANRMYPNVANALLPVLDGTGELVVATETYKRGQNIIFIATMNRGSQYHGTFDSDAAFLNRFGISAQLGNMDITQETNIVYHHNPSISMENAGRIVGLLRELRKTLVNSQLDFSPRTAENIASAISSGLSFYLAFKVVLHSLCTNEEWKAIVDSLGTNGLRDQGSKPDSLF